MLIKYSRLLVFLMVGILNAQVFDDFQDGDYSNNPVWSGDTMDFKVNNDFTLQLFADPPSGLSRIYTVNQAISNAIFEFNIKLDFNPSSQNYLEVYLQVEGVDFETSDAVFLRVGDSQDRIGLFKRVNGSNELMFDSSDGLLNNSENDVQVKVTRNSGGLWKVDIALNGGQMETIGQGIEVGMLSTNYFGFDCHYTSTRSTKFYIDNIQIEGSPFLDIEAPEVIDFRRLDSFQVLLNFNEPLDTQFIVSEMFQMEPAGNVKSLIYNVLDSSVVCEINQLDWNQESSIKIGPLQDLSGNSLADTNFSIRWQKIYPSDLLITEIMFDPEPSVYLPEFEYIELYNTKDYPLSLEGVQLSIDGKTTVFGIDSILPKSYLVVGSMAEEVMLLGVDQYIALGYFPSMSNTSSFLSLKTAENVFVHGVKYDKSWHIKAKQNGGWSLEMIDQELYCLSEEGWASSRSLQGGSPGRMNVALDSMIDLQNEYYLEVNGVQEIVLTSLFVMEDPNWEDPKSFVLNGEYRVNEVERVSERSILLRTDMPLSLRTGYQLGITFLSNNCLNEQEGGVLVNFSLPEMPKADEVKVSEILFNPLDGKEKFIEFVHEGMYPIDCYDLLLGQKNEADHTWSYYNITGNHEIWYPDDFLVVTTSVNGLRDQYNCGERVKIIGLKSFPSLPISGGQGGLFRRNHIALDTFCYEDDWHAGHLLSTKGVSLERIDFNANPCLESTWGSASENSDYASPGSVNSYHEISNNGARLSISSDILAPNLKFYEIIISFNLISPEEKLSIEVYTIDGILIAVLARNKFALGKGNLQWTGEGLAVGSYILMAAIEKNGKQVIKEKWLINIRL